MQQANCIPCQAKRELEKAKMNFLINTAHSRAVETNQDHVIYFDSEDNKFRVSTFSEAVARGEEIVQVVSRFEAPAT